MTGKIKKRHPAAAALLSLCMMGLGQLYNGQPQRAVVFFALFFLPYVAGYAISGYLLSFQGIMALFLAVTIGGGIWIFAVIDAFLGARRAGKFALRRYNCWYVYLSVFLAVAIIHEAVDLAYKSLYDRPVGSYSILSGAMEPTLLVGDYVSADNNAYDDQGPKRGDIAVFRKPPENEIDYISRIVGLPEDRIQVLDGRLQINGEAVDREHIENFVMDMYGREVAQYIETLPNGPAHRILETAGDKGVLDNTREFMVPEGHYFFMGDNRDNSSDSRVFGFIPAANLVGRAEILFYSMDGDAALWEVWKWPFDIRFERIGLRID